MIALPIVLVAAVLVGPSFVDWNQYRDELAAQGKALTGRDITIGGDITIALLPTPAVVARDVRVANLDGASAPEMVRLGSLEVRIALGPLLGGNIQIETVRLIEPVIELEVLADGRRNWDLAPVSKTGAPPAASPPTDKGPAEAVSDFPVRLDDFVVKDGVIVYRDAQSGTVERVKVVSATLAAASLSGPFESSGRLEVGGISLDYEAAVSGIIHQRTVPFSLALGVDAGVTRVHINGTLVGLAETPKFKGKIKVGGKNLAGLIRMGTGDIPLPGFLGQTFGAEGNMVASASGAEVKNLTVTLGETEAKGSVVVEMEKGIATAVRLAVQHINLDKWLSMPATVSANAAAPPSEPEHKDGKPRASIALTPSTAAQATKAFVLPAGVNGSIVASVDALTFRGGLVRQVKANLELADGDVTISQLSAQFPGGSDVALFGLLSTEDGQPRFEGNVEGKVNELRRLLGWLGIEPPPVPQDRLRTLELSSELSVTSKEVQARAIKLKIDNSRITGGVTVALRRRPAFGADLSLDSLNLDSYLNGAPKSGQAAASPDPAKGSGGTTQAGKAGASSSGAANPFAALSMLNTIDANLKARIGSVIYRRTTIKKIALDGTLFNGTLELRKASVADLAGASARVSGTITGLAGVPELKGVRFDLGAANLARLLRLADVEPPVPPDKLGAVKINGRLEGSLLRPSVKLNVKAAGGAVSLSAKVSVLTLLGGIEMAVTASHPDLIRLLGRLDVNYRPVGPIGAVKLAATVTVDDSTVTVTGIDARLGSVAVKGRAVLGLAGARPKVTADLTTGKIDIDRFLPAQRKAGLPNRWPLPHTRSGIVPAAWPGVAPAPGPSPIQPVAAGRGATGRWSPDPIDLSVLQAFDADLKVAAAALTFDKYTLNNAQVRATVKDGTLSADRVTGQLFGGALNATAVVRSAPAVRANAAITLKDVDVRQVLGAVAGKSAVGGRINMDLTLIAQGRSVAELVAALGGKGSLALRGLDVKGGARGTILAPVLGLLTAVQQLGGGLGGKGGAGLADVTASFLIERGVARTQDLKLVSNLSNGEARGSVNLVDWTLDVGGQLTMAQNLLTRLLASKVRIPQKVPFEVKGSLDAPTIKLLKGSGGTTEGGGTGIKPLDRLLRKKGLGGVLDRILPGLTGGGTQTQPPPPPPSPDGKLPPPPPPPPTEQKTLRPEDLLKQLFKIR